MGNQTEDADHCNDDEEEEDQDEDDDQILPVLQAGLVTIQLMYLDSCSGEES